jgi:MoaA/NifB/PqqE/SkfB family radical SAM enzyme
MWRSAKNLLAQALSGGESGWHPLLAVYYLTYACDFRCPYCSDGEGRPYHTLADQALPADGALALLARIRRRCDHLVLTGGEPLRYRELDAVLRGLPALRFDTVVLTTNGYALPADLGGLRRALTHLVFSLDTLDPVRADATYGVGAGALQQILDNIDRAAASSKGGAAGSRRGSYEIVISAVATPDNITDLYRVYDYAKGQGFRFAVCPQLVGVHPHPGLRDNAEYQALFAHLIAERKRGEAIQGSPLYLEHMQTLRQFDCRPSTLLAVAPAGDVFYPCLELGTIAGNLLETDDLDAIQAAGRARFGPKAPCGNRCQSACALGFGLLFSHPLSALEDLLLSGKGALRRLSARKRRTSA